MIISLSLCFETRDLSFFSSHCTYRNWPPATGGAALPELAFEASHSLSLYQPLCKRTILARVFLIIDPTAVTDRAQSVYCFRHCTFSTMFEKVVVVDARAHMMGRLASVVAKELLNGQHVVLVRCEGINISGSRE